jgi:signal transduction histidine kinase
MRIVFNNLIDNAIKYSAQPVSIDVKVYCSAKHVSIEIKDQGVGISVRDQKRIFNKFERIDSQDSPSVKGTGLGLYWVREIIRYHGGKISIQSEGTNRGTTFKIELPVYRASKKRYIKNLLKISKYRSQKMEVEND